MKDLKSYDGDLQMFREHSQEVNLAHLGFVRWLVEHGRLEHLPAGPPSGPLAGQPALEEALAPAA